jgi:hypothetical protein
MRPDPFRSHSHEAADTWLDPDCELRDHRSAAVGQRRRHAGSAAWHAWRCVGPLLLGLYGVGLIGAAMFTADPGMGFPPGTPEQTIISTRGLMHLVVGSIGFLGFVVTCFVFARRSASSRNRNGRVFH